MNNTTHTPGPWTVTGRVSLGIGKNGQDVMIHAGSGRPVAEAYTCKGRGPEVAMANARLIAAAPDLLEAARSIGSVHGLLEAIGPARWNALAAAVAKATGEKRTAFAGPNGIVALDRHEDQVEARAS